MEHSYGAPGGSGRAPGAGAAPHYSDLSNPQIIETLQKQGNYAQMDEGQGAEN